MTSNTPEAMDERAAFEAWAVTILGDNPTWRGSGDCELAWQSWKAARANLPLPQGDAELAIDNALCSVLPGVYYMDPPDGGSITPLEQVQRMAKDAARYRWLRNGEWEMFEDRWLTSAPINIYGEDGLAMDDAIDAARLTPGGQQP